MGQRPTRLKGKGVSSNVPKKFSKDGKAKQGAIPEKADNNIAKPGMIFTKGSSMALPDQQDKLNRPVLNADAQEIEQFLQDELKEFLVEDDYENPVYMKIDKEYKVGNAVVYPPTMDQNITFELREIDPTEVVDGDKPNGNDVEHGLEQNVQVTFAYKSLQGKTDNRPASMVPDKPNQDSVAVVRDRKTPYRAIFGVFDGHGPYGEHASHFCRMEMLKMYAIANKQHPNDSSEQLLGHTLRYLDRKFAGTDHRAAKIDPIVSGTTAIVVMLDGNKIIAANVGDSRAILATKQTDGSILAVPLSDDHKPERPDERARIEASSAILLNEHEVRGRAPNPDPSNPGKTYICRHSNGEIVYGVLFTRSIGDVDAHKHLGVSSEPEFISHKVHENVDNGNEQVIVIASDGVWDMMSNEECAQICFNFLDPIAACEDIVQKCSDRWGRSGEGRRDDITVCVVGLGIKFGNNTTRGNRMGSYYGLI